MDILFFNSQQTGVYYFHVSTHSDKDFTLMDPSIDKIEKLKFLLENNLWLYIYLIFPIPP